MSEPRLFARDSVTHLRVIKDTIYTWIAEKVVPAHEVGRFRNFQACVVDDWVRRGGASASARDGETE